ncbi:hypothetical protein D3C83_84410 [compost metagenome]
MKGHGLGRVLLSTMIRYCRERGTGTLSGEVLASNRAMLALVAGLGFEVSQVPTDLSIVKVALTLNSSGKLIERERALR